MGTLIRGCLQSLLNLLNSVVGVVGMALIMYAVWLLRVWHRETGDVPLDGSDLSTPWFCYTSLGVGLIFCLIACIGHIAAHTVNGCLLYLYMFLVLLLVMLEVGVTVDVFLNRQWKEDFPDDPSGSFNKFIDFVKSNFEICKWIGLSILSVQGFCFLLVMLLQAIGPYQCYDSDEEFAPERVPLVKHGVHSPTCVVGSPIYGHKNDAWSIRIADKVCSLFCAL